MGRSRGNFHANDEDPTQRSRRKKNVSSENAESSAAGQGAGEGKRALYHCNYCNKDLTGRVRMKCAICTDFDLCVECFSVGAEVTPHKSNHPYKVMDNLSFPLICYDWNADDEMLLLEGIEMYGFWNWAEVAEHVGTKTKERCIEHYDSVYMNSPFFPLPDLSHIVGKNKEELLAMAKAHIKGRIGSTMPGELTLKEESPFSPSRVKLEEPHKGGPSGRLISCSNSEPQAERSFKGEEVMPSVNDGPSLFELSGYNPKRQEFDPEYDNDAEQLLAEMEFKDTDTEEEHELKLRVLHAYSRRLDERQRRKDFILERNLLYPNPFEKDLSPEERAICRRYDVFMRFHSKEEHEDLLQTVISEHRTLKKIQELQEAQAAGCRTTAEADRYLELKRQREAEEASRISKDSANAGPSSQGGANAFMASGSVRRDSNLRPAGQASASHVNDFDILGFVEMQLLSEAEKRLCCEIRLPPPRYLRMQEIISREVFSGNVTKKADAHRLFRIEANTVDRVYDMLVKKGLAPR